MGQYSIFMKEIETGFYSFSGKPFPTEKNLVVAVHPFFWHHPFLKNQFDDYLVKLNNFLRQRNSPIILMEEHQRVDVLARHLVSLRLENRLIVKTNEGSPTFSEIPPESFLKYVSDLKGDKPVDLIGGNLYRRGRDIPKWDGCLGIIAKLFHEEGISFNFLEQLVFGK